MVGPRADSEQRTAVSLAVAVALAAQYLAPEGYRLQPTWLLPAVAASLALLIAVGGRRVEDPGHWSLRALALGLGAALALGNLAAVALLVHGLISGHAVHAAELLRIGAAAWLTNVIAFSVIFWEVDAGGPVARARADARPHADLFFPQYSLDTHVLWAAKYIDYAYVSLTNATAFSPTDTLPLTPRMKVLMAAQSTVALIAIAVVFARAVNILGT
ncbi:MAG: hypothetical protein EB027_00930 [Actinobacteria bacterium]|nr:hypothetical protein [Actinomycetota bacterium]